MEKLVILVLLILYKFVFSFSCKKKVFKAIALIIDELQNAKEKLNQSYFRLNTLMLITLEAQPIASNAILDLLDRAIKDGTANLNASHASIQEIKRGWNLS